jgi:macrodomain Ter protein organizer (MatP/YcbG family)
LQKKKKSRPFRHYRTGHQKDKKKKIKKVFLSHRTVQKEGKKKKKTPLSEEQSETVVTLHDDGTSALRSNTEVLCLLPHTIQGY